MTDKELLDVVPYALIEDADVWCKANSRRFCNWRDFEKSFTRHYIGEYDEVDIMDEINHRMQGSTKKVGHFLSKLLYLIDLLHKPLSRQHKVKISLRNLRPAYRHYMEDHDVRSWSDIENYGERFEKRLEKDQHFAEPRPKNKMIIPGAAWKIRRVRSRKSNSSKTRMKNLLVKRTKRTKIMIA